MTKPIVIDSPVEFLIVGPIGNKDGLLIHSKNASLELIATTFHLYRSAEFDRKEKFLTDLMSENKLRFMFEKFRIEGHQRNERLLFCWRFPADGDMRHLSGEELRSGYTKEFFRFIEDSGEVLSLLALATTLSDISYESLKASVLWNISPLILKLIGPAPDKPIVFSRGSDK